MNLQNLSNILDRLAHAEQRSLIPRLHEATVKVSWSSADQADALGGMVAEECEHVAWLTELIVEFGESPTPWTADLRTTSWHFVELDYLIPRVIEDKRNLIRFYEDTAPQLSPSPEAALLVGRIIERHRSHLAALEKMSPDLKPADSSG